MELTKMSNMQTESLVKSTLALLTTEEKTRGEAIQSLVYLLVIAHQEKQMPVGVDLLQAYKHTDKKPQQARNNALLTHLFKVMDMVQTEKGPTYRAKESIAPNVISLLKNRINKTLIVAAWIAKNGGTESEMVRKNPNGLLSVRGKIYFTDKQLKDAPDLEKNWVSLDGKSGAGSGKYELLYQQSQKGLNWKKSGTGTKVDHVANAPMKHVAEVLEDKLNLVQSGEKLVGKMELDAMRKLFVVLGAAIKYATKNLAPEVKTSAGETVAAIKAKDKNRKHLTAAQVDKIKGAAAKARKEQATA
jgi:hypothetical protein